MKSLKRIGEKNLVKFYNSIEDFLHDQDVEVRKNYIGQNRVFKLKSGKKSCTITMHEPDETALYSLFCKFDSTNILTSVHNSKFNFHQFGDFDQVLEEAKDHIKSIIEVLK